MDTTDKKLIAEMDAADMLRVLASPKALAAWNAVEVGDVAKIGPRVSGKVVRKSGGCITIDVGCGLTVSRTGRAVAHVRKVR